MLDAASDPRGLSERPISSEVAAGLGSVEVELRLGSSGRCAIDILSLGRGVNESVVLGLDLSLAGLLVQARSSWSYLKVLLRDVRIRPSRERVHQRSRLRR